MALTMMATLALIAAVVVVQIRRGEDTQEAIRPAA